MRQYNFQVLQNWKKLIFTFFTHFWAILSLFGVFRGSLGVLLPQYPSASLPTHLIAMTRLVIHHAQTLEEAFFGMKLDTPQMHGAYQ